MHDRGLHQLQTWRAVPARPRRTTSSARGLTIFILHHSYSSNHPYKDMISLEVGQSLRGLPPDLHCRLCRPVAWWLTFGQRSRVTSASVLTFSPVFASVFARLLLRLSVTSQNILCFSRVVKGASIEQVRMPASYWLAPSVRVNLVCPQSFHLHSRTLLECIGPDGRIRCCRSCCSCMFCVTDQMCCVPDHCQADVQCMTECPITLVFVTHVNAWPPPNLLGLQLPSFRHHI